MNENKPLIQQQVAEIEITYKNSVRPSERLKITSSKDAFELLKSLWSDKIEYVEEFYVLLSNKANKVLGITKISEGGTSGCLVDPKRIFQTALKSNASGIILSHNHPSGNLQPSEADCKITRKVKEIGYLLEISALDHLIVSLDGYYSFADEGSL
jgi:DNA repair protein RadC